MVINPLNLLKSESSKFSQESAKKRMKTDQKRLESAHNQKMVLTQQSDYQLVAVPAWGSEPTAKKKG